MSFELWLPALVLFIVTLGVTLMADSSVRKNPRCLVSTGTVVRTTVGGPDNNRGTTLRYPPAPGAGLLASAALESLPFESVITGPLMFVTISGVSTWAFMRMMTQGQRADRRRIRDADDDHAHHLTELTPLGLRCLQEAQRR